MNEEIRVTFIVPDGCRSENDCSEDMLLAFTACSQHCSGGLEAQWAHESQWSKFDGLTRRDVFVLSEFEGHLYEKLKLTKCLLVGPRCLSCCLTEGAPIPSGPEPVYTVAMRGLVVTASGLSKNQKEAIKKKVFWMGGIYSTVLSDETTHLVSDTVLSDKYIKSVEKGIPIMHESWVTAVWDASLIMNISGSSPDFDGHRLQPFANLQVTTSGISKLEKQTIMKLVNENGGQFSGAFQSETTDVVVMTKESLGSEKHKAAIEYGKVCVLPSWVKDSAARGVSQPMSKYKVTGASTSSPLAEHRLPEMSLNFSRITNSRPPSNYVDETRSVDVTASSARIKLSQESRRVDDTSLDKDMVAAFENFDMSLLKKAGPIFDGFCIWVYGMEGVCRERVSGAVSRCGGVRYSGAHERVTHAVCARGHAPLAARAAPRAHVLSPLWVLRSVQAGHALDEGPFLYDVEKQSTPVKSRPIVEAESPMSKKNLQLLRPALNLPPPTPEVEEPQEDLVHHYLSQNIPEIPREITPESSASGLDQPGMQPNITDDLDEDPTEEVEQIFRGIKMEVQGLEEEAVCEVGAEVGGAGGAVVAAGAGGEYALVPLDFDVDELVNKSAQPVSVFWIKDCLAQQELLPVQYYHRPVKLPVWDPNPGPLHGVVASLSTYSGVERAFLDELAKLLGAKTQLRFCRRNTANALASTHLICPTPTGDKYLGAKKWGLPAVRGSWLLACVAAGRRVSERDHLVGDTQAPLSPHQEEEQENIETNKQTDVEKENALLPEPTDTTVPRRGSASNVEQIKMNDCGGEMSPASRYIAMARQGLLGADSQDTPQRVRDLQQDNAQDAVRTPPLDEALSSPALGALSASSRRRARAVRRGDPPSGPINTPQDPLEKKLVTPDSAFGAALRAGAPLSPAARKRLWAVVSELPGKPPNHVANTPLSEIKNRFLARFNNDASTPPSDHTAAPRKLDLQDADETPPPKMAKLSEDHSVSKVTQAEVEVEVDAEVEADVDAHAQAVAEVETSGALPAEVDAQLQRLHAALHARPASQRRRTLPAPPPPQPQAPEVEAGPESQPNTVGWDDTTPHANTRTPTPTPTPEPHLKRFMLSSNVDNREEIIEMIIYLGGTVSDSPELDPQATHLLCAAPGRSEKMLGSVAAGRWVLHPAYVPRSRANGAFLPEEEFEWGNPLATCLPVLSGAERVLARAAHRWRAARGEGGAGPFAGVRALLHVPAARRRLLARLLAAGGGVALDHEPPYSCSDMTVCFADTKRCPVSERDAAWLAARRVPVCAPVLLSSYLTDDVAPDPWAHCLPEFAPH